MATTTLVRALKNASKPRLMHFRNISNNPLNRPGPPPLPPQDQKVFDDLVRQAATPAARPAPELAIDPVEVKIEKGNELHPDARRPLPRDFEGEVNPLTGEVGGPKREPLKHGDWSYGGRATDF